MTKAKLLKVTISGSFKASDGDVESYDKVVGFMPALDEDKTQQMAIRRYARIWIPQTMKRDRDGNETEEPKYKRLQRVREVFIDDVEEVNDKQLSYVGKDIMEMNFEELQDLAAAKDLASIPLYKTGSLTNARRIAFAEYANKVLGWTEPVKDPRTNKIEQKPLDWRRDGFRPANYPQIIADGKIRRDSEAPADIESSIETENLLMKHGNAAPPSEGQSRLTIEQLKQIAKAKNISFQANIGYDTLYKKIYGGDKAA